MKANSLFVTFFLLISCPFSGHAEPYFYLPKTESEKALDAIIKRADADDFRVNNLFQTHEAVPANKKIDYSEMLTTNAIEAMQQEEKRLVDQNCGGVYQEGELCGLDFQTINCAQDESKTYYYHTIQQSGLSAIIEYAWEQGDDTQKPHSIVATYKLVKDQDAWKIDGVKCNQIRASFSYD